MTSRALPASHRALPMVCPEFATSSWARFSRSASTASAKRAQQPGPVAGRDGAPLREGSTRSGDRLVRRVLVEQFDARDEFLGRRVQYVVAWSCPHIRSKPRIRSQSVTAAS